MANYMSIETLKYLLSDVHDIKELLDFERFQDYDEDAIDLLIDSTKDWADQEFFPYYVEMDAQPVVYKDGKIIVHPQVGKVLKDAGEKGFIGPHFDYEHGGAQMPHLLATGLNHIIQAANNSLPGYIGLTAGSAELIAHFGSKELQDTYIPKMMSGQWGGTMALTEPQAGSSLSDISTSAIPNDDGSYNISGQKIFISGGDHEYCDNFVHLTLARIEGAPAGTKGISLFVVPKYRPTQGDQLEDNDVITAGDFQKLGQRGYATTHLVFGENNNCKGWLVGAPNKGLKSMFLMMNGARIDVGLTAASTACAAYYASLQYANERPQGRKMSNDGSKNAEEGQTTIINHPDVRRMLLLQKAIVEGSLSLLLECSKNSDLSLVLQGEDSEKQRNLLELLTPIAKTYPSEMGRLSINNGLQIFGGYGFCMDFPLQQYYRDIRIMSLYEGTTGIQSLDLLGRKITMKNGQALNELSSVVMQSIAEAKKHEELSPYADKLGSKLKETQEILTKLLPFALQGNYERYLSDATIFMEYFGTITIAWQWLKMATKAQENIESGNMKFAKEFYESKIHTMKFFYKYELSRSTGLKEILMSDEVLTILKDKELIS